MINNELQNGEVQMQSTVIASYSPELKAVTPLELSNIDTSMPNILALGFDASVMLEIVAGSMYKDKLIAMQEVTANGRDAIVRRAETDKDFIPEIVIRINSTTNEISISDNGCGMSKELVDSVYRIFGRSDKRNTANEEGMFGIGGKSFFALVDEFEVTTISMLTHKKLSFIVTKRGIMITEDEVPTTEPCGTIVKATIPKEYSSYDIKNRVKNAVKTWLCPVYYIEDNSSYRERLSHKPPEEILLSDVKEGYYAGLTDSKIKYINPYTFSFYFTDSGDSHIYIGNIPYTFSTDFPIPIQVIMYAHNIVTLTATRESIEKDSKFDEFHKQLKLKTLEALSSQFDKYFKNLPKNLSDIKNMDDNIIMFFNKLLYANLIDIRNYPYFHIMDTAVKQYYDGGHRTKSIYKTLQQYTHVYYTHKKLISTTASIIFHQLPINSIILSLPEECTKFCLFCREYNIDNECSKEKHPMSLIRDIAKPIPVLSATATLTRTSLRGINATSMRSGVTKRISHSELHDYTYTKTSFATDNSDIFLVTEKQFKRLKSEGYNVIEDIEAYKTSKLAETFLEDSDGNKISALLLKKHRIIIHGTKDINKIALIKALYPSALILKQELSSEIIKTLLPTQKVLSIYQLNKDLQHNKSTVKFTVSVPISDYFDRIVYVTNANSTISKIKIISHEELK